MQMPTIGRIVHYINLGDQDRQFPPVIQAAMITGLYKRDLENGQLVPANEPGSDAGRVFVDLKIFYRTGFFDLKAVRFSEQYERGRWSWPPKV